MRLQQTLLFVSVFFASANFVQEAAGANLLGEIGDRSTVLRHLQHIPFLSFPRRSIVVPPPRDLDTILQQQFTLRAVNIEGRENPFIHLWFGQHRPWLAPMLRVQASSRLHVQVYGIVKAEAAIADSIQDHPENGSLTVHLIVPDSQAAVEASMKELFEDTMPGRSVSFDFIDHETQPIAHIE